MAIITDPDLLARTDIIFGTAAQQISIYPVGDTQRVATVSGDEYIDLYVSAVGTITTAGENFSTDSVAVGDVVAIQNTVNAGHWYVNTEATPILTLTAIDDGTGGAATSALVVAQTTFDGADVTTGTDQITITAHGYVTGDALVLNGTTLPTELTTATVYYAIRIDNDEIQLATTYANAVAGTPVDIITANAGTGHTLDDRLIGTIWTNGASASEAINGNDTSGDGLGDVADGTTLQATYSFGKEEWRVDSQIADVVSSNYNDDLIRHQFPYEAITSEQFEAGGGTSHDNWNWFNLYTRKKVRTAGWAEKTDVGTGDLARETGIITLGSVDGDAQVYYQQTSIVTPKVDFTFLGPVNEALKIYDDASADNTPEDDFTTFLKLFVRKKGRTYAGSEISDIGVTTIQTIVNRFPLAHAVDTAINLTDANLLGTNPYSFAEAPVALITDTDGIKTSAGATFTNTGTTDFAAAGVVPGDILEITTADADEGFYEILTVATSTLTIKEFETVSGNDFTFGTGWTTTLSGTTAFSIHTSVLTPKAGLVSVRDSGTLSNVIADTGIIDVDGATGTLTDTDGTFVTDGIAADDILIIDGAGELTFDAATDVDDSTEIITIANHNFRTGDRVVYDDDGGTPVGGLTDGSVYYVSVISTSTFYLCTTLANAWTRHYGDTDHIDLTDGVGVQILHLHELDGCYNVISATATELTLDTIDGQFPTTIKANVSYRIVEPGMYLQYKDKTVDRFNDTQTTTPLTDVTYTGFKTLSITGPDFDYDDDTGANVQIQEGDMIEISGSTNNDGRYTVDSRTSASIIVIKETFASNDAADHAGTTISIEHGFERTIGDGDFSFNWKISGNGGTLNNVFEVVQSELRSSADIDCGAGTFVPADNTGLVGFIGNINDLLMSFASPTGTGLNLFIDDLAASDINNATFNDHTGTSQKFPFTASGSLIFNPNLTNDQNSKYWLFFTTDDAGDNLGRDYGSEFAIIVNDATSPTPNPIQGFVNASGGATHGGTRTVDSGTTSITFTYDFDGNDQRGTASKAVAAPVTLVAIGAPTAQFVIAAGSITATTGIAISAVASLERNYSGALTP